MSMTRAAVHLVAAAVLVTSTVACSDDTVAPELNGPEAALSVGASAPPPPAGLVNVAFGPASLQVWPWTGRDLSGITADPINLLFVGEVDVVSLRAALLSVDGDRAAYGFPAAPPFNCTWTDAHGEMQTTYTNGDGWVGNAIQLQCGDYDPLRFHIRLFNAGSWVVAAVHFDLLIPNTPSHQVIAWELPQQLVVVDFLRSGVLDPGAPVGIAAVNPPGSVQVIPKPIYDGIPDALKVPLGLPPGPAPASGVPVPNDGLATILNVGTAAPVTADYTESSFTQTFGQVIPRPFCAQGPTDFVLVQGPVDITTRTRVNDNGMLETNNTLRGDLNITPIDIATGAPSGPTFRAQISQIDNTSVGPNGTRINAVQQRKALPQGTGFLKTHLVTGPNGAAHFTTSEKCN